MRKRGPQINFQIGEELLEDMKVIAHRRGQTLSECIRRILEEELVREANREVME